VPHAARLAAALSLGVSSAASACSFKGNLIVRILALTRYERLGSSSRVRFYQYIPYLRSQGTEIVTAPFFDDGYVRKLYAGQHASTGVVLQAYLKRLSVLLRSASFDLLWVEKELLPWIPAWLENIFHIRQIPYVVDYDDAVFHRYDLHRSALVRALLGRKIDGVMRHAALVIAGNRYLAERARKAGAPRVECLPSVVDVSQYALTEPSEGHGFRIGWIGSPVTAPYLKLVREAVATLNRETPLTITLIGAGSVQPFPNVLTEVLPWSEAIELNLSQQFDVGIMPLVDGPFERGKCGYKLVQYMASGLPVVASPVGVNQEIVEPQDNGYLAASSEEWLAALRELRDSAEKRKMMGLAGRRKAEQKYNLRGTAPTLFRLLGSLTKP
jgi:glycosyltransferase involved in cell wall biosynthesis